MPFGHNDNYVQLPEESEFCVKYGDKNLIFKTDIEGGRYFVNSKNNIIQVFGDSQILGLDIQNQQRHFLSQYYPENLIIYAAPNNGPYEVLNFIILNQEKIKKRIIISFNLSVDIFRIFPDWDIKNYVALRDYQLHDILDKPYKYRLVILKSLITNKFFTISRKNQNEMQELFQNINTKDFERNFKIYLKILNEIIKNYDLEVEYILTMPYWIYELDKKTKNYFINSNLENKLNFLICSTFVVNDNLNNTYITSLDKSNEILTRDERHLRMDNIVLTDLNNYCKN